METDGIAARLKQLINYLELSDSQFADKCGISRATLSLLLSGKNKKISDILLSQIHEAFPKVSIMWLLFKEGKITNDDNLSSSLHRNGHEDDMNDYQSSLNLFGNDDFQDSIINDNDENPISSSSNEGKEKNSNLIGLNLIEKQIQEAVSKGFERFFKNYNSYNEIDDIAEKGKKIRQITVYYDDSTFETFSPGGR